MRLVLDAMGGDHAPAAPVEGALSFAREHPAHEVVLVGDLVRLREPLARAGGLPPNVRLHPASQVWRWRITRSPPSAAKKALEAALQTAQAGSRTELTRCIADAAAWLPARQRGKGATADAFSD